MSAVKLDGTALARKLRAALAPRAAALKKAGRPPVLCLVTREKPDRAALAYRETQKKACEAVGISWLTLSAEWRGAGDVLKALALNANRRPGVLLDLPLNDAVEIDAVVAGIAPEADVEGVTPLNFGRLFEAKSYGELRRRGLVAPCTALAVAELARASGAELSGRRAVVLGRSNIVGKPAAHLLSCLDMTVTLCHSKTRELPELVREADVVVAAMGKAGFVKAGWIKPGAVVIDAGINAAAGRFCGDVEPAASERAGQLTPVPGGVGPVTTAMLLSNTIMLAERRS